MYVGCLMQYNVCVICVKQDAENELQIDHCTFCGMFQEIE
jgi:hypothetical protein